MADESHGKVTGFVRVFTVSGSLGHREKHPNMFVVGMQP